jgi:hypothetical protein
MKINYRILSVDEKEGSVVVRYWTDELSERQLSIDSNEQADTPEHCRTDTNLNIWRPDATDSEISDAILRCAPVDWLGLKEKINDPQVDTSLAQVKSMVGISRSGEIVPPAPIPQIGRAGDFLIREEDITDLLDAAPDPVRDALPNGVRVFFHRLWIKTNDGPWTYPTNYTSDEVSSIVNPYTRLFYGACKGILARPQVYFDSSTTFITKYTLDSVENARAMYQFLKTNQSPEVLALKELSRKYRDAAGTTYDAGFRLTRDIPR